MSVSGGSRDIGANRPTAGFLATLVALTLSMNTIGRGVTETFPVFLLPVETYLEATRAEITAAYSIYMLVHGLAAPIAGQLVDRLGCRWTYATGLSAIGLGSIGAGYAESLYQYYLFYGVFGGLGAACLGMVIATSLLSRWFTKNLGTMVAIPHAATGFGVLLIPPLAQMLLMYVSWQETYRIIGIVVLGFLPILFILPVNRMTTGSPHWQLRRRRLNVGPVWTVARALRTESFWSLFLLFLFTSGAAYAVLPQSVAFLIESGFDPLFAAGAFGFSGALSGLGIIAAGWISDRAGRLATVTVSKLMTLTGILSLLAVAWFPSAVLVYAFVVFFGLVQGARGPVIAVLVAILFRGGSVGAIYGTLSIAMGAGAAIGSWTSGWLHDTTGDYVASFVLGATCSVCGLATYWISPSLRTERPAKI
ncbi:MAG: MFS transporter [Hyphomicrobiaceae bacterium]